MIRVWQITAGALSVACFLSFAWAIRRHFAPAAGDPGTTAGMRAITLLGTLSMALQVFAIITMDEVSLPFAAAGALLYVASGALFWWAVAATRKRRLTLAFSTDAPQFLLTSGPYRFVRHPFYTAYTLFWLAGVLATKQWWLLFAVAVMLTLYVRAARLEEEKFAASALRADYVSYRGRTGMFLPRVHKTPLGTLRSR